MFFARSLYNLGLTYVERRFGLRVFTIVVLIASVVGFLWQNVFTFFLFDEPIVLLSLFPALAALIFIHMGRLWKLYLTQKFSWYSIIVCFLFYLASAYCGGMGMFSGRYPNLLLNIFGAAGGTVCLFFISEQIERVDFLCRVLQWIGKSSLFILCIHCVDFVFGFRVHVSDTLTQCFCMTISVLLVSYYLSKLHCIRRIFYL